MEGARRLQDRAQCRLARKNSPNTGLPTALVRKNSPSAPENSLFHPFRACGANFFALTHTPGRAGRTFSRTGRSNVAALKPTTPLQPLTWASMKPPSPLRAPEQQPLKPTTPLQPKNGLKTPISHPQRRSRFHSHTDTSEQRRRRGQAAAPMGSGEAWPGDRWPADVTNVVKPTRFQSPCDGFCYKRRQSKPKNH